MATPDLKLKWFRALHEGDCLKIELLLKEDKSLVTIYPRIKYPVNQAGSCQHASGFAANCDGWKGCSALHVAVKRAWPFLVQMIVNLFEQEEIAGTSAAHVGHGDESNDKGKEAMDLSMLEELLLALDGDYRLDAMALAVVNGNETIVKILARASSKCTNNPFSVPPPFLGSDFAWTGLDALDRHSTGFEDSGFQNLKVVINNVLCINEVRFRKIYETDLAYNFLPVELFFLHHSIASFRNYHNFFELRRIMDELKKRGDEEELTRLMFSLKDGMGKTLAHVLPAEYADWFLRDCSKDEIKSFFHVRDGSGTGRTVAHAYVAGNGGVFSKYVVFNKLVEHLGCEELTAKCSWKKSGLFQYINLDALYTRNGYPDYHFESELTNVLHESSALHYLALHNCSTLISGLINDRSQMLDWNGKCCMRMEGAEKSRLWRAFSEYKNRDGTSVNIIQVAALSGSDNVVKALLPVDRAFDDARLKNLTSQETSISILFIASATGDPAKIQALLASRKFDPLVTAESGDTALHFAASADYSTPMLKPHLLDLVDVSHRPGIVIHNFRYSDSKKRTEEEDRAADSRRKGCINLLLQAGIDIWQKNREGNIADPGENASSDFCLWWYEKLERETQGLKDGLISAANAISVTAALVASASFSGGFSAPPEPGNLQVEYIEIRIFIVCNTLAFYLSLVSILFSLMPVVPLPQESMLDELAQVRKIVTLAILFLILSVVLLLLAFAAASIVVIPNDFSWNHGALTISTIPIGGVWILYLLYLFLLRLGRLVFHRNTWLRRNHRRMTLIN